jgi:radical SAM/Cys-rich protein
MADCSSSYPFIEQLSCHGLAPLKRGTLEELQVNVGRLCNQACSHCHVDAGPKRTEIMTWGTMEKIIGWLETTVIRRIDITGGAPELNPNFRRLVDTLLALQRQITARCNLTVLRESGQEDLAQWYAERRVRLVCSLPCYSQENVDRQRGDGVFEKSIAALRILNDAGYGRSQGLTLDLVYNPGDAYLPPSQEKLEEDYKHRLRQDFGIEFNRLLTITNLPINRFAHYLKRTGQLDRYMDLLIENFNPATVNELMCRHIISVDWLGRIFDCDFNQMLDLPLAGKPHRYLWEIEATAQTDRAIAVGSHCLGCTAGAGSSCGGALT